MNIALPRVIEADGERALQKQLRMSGPVRESKMHYSYLSSIRRCTTSKSKLGAGKELYSIAKTLKIEHKKDADLRLYYFIYWN